VKHIGRLLIITSIAFISCKKENNNTTSNTENGDIRLKEIVAEMGDAITKIEFQYEDDKLAVQLKYRNEGGEMMHIVSKTEINYLDDKIEEIVYNYSEADSSYTPTSKSVSTYEGDRLIEMDAYYFNNIFVQYRTMLYQYQNNKLIRTLDDNENGVDFKNEFMYDGDFISTTKKFSGRILTDEWGQDENIQFYYVDNKIDQIISQYKEGDTWINRGLRGFDYSNNNQTKVNYSDWNYQLNNWDNYSAYSNYIYNNQGVLLEELSESTRIVYNYESGSGNANLFYKGHEYQFRQLPSVKNQRPMGDALMQELRPVR
jgi:hypothetical protein